MRKMDLNFFERFSAIVVLDVETTGLNCKIDQVIEFGAVRIEKSQTEFVNFLVQLPEGISLSPFIVQLTGITDAMLSQSGISPISAAEEISGLLSQPDTLLVAYNAQFDLCFLYYLLEKQGLADCLRNVKLLDALTVYKDRRPYPHTLADAVKEFQLKAQNTHRAVDDAQATWELVRKMQEECADLENYLNLFGYNPKYGISGPRISSVTYCPQEYDSKFKLYQAVERYKNN